MEALHRSSVSFRRQGSSGLVWEDRFLSGDLNQMKKKEEEEAVEFRELRPSLSEGSIGMLDRNRSNGGKGWRTGKVSPAIDPPSPKVSACGFCGVFGKSSNHRDKNKNKNNNNNKRPKSRRR